MTKTTKLGHITRFSDSSLYDEVCTICGATDGPSDTGLLRQCRGYKSDITEIARLQNISERQSAHLAQALWEKNELWEKLQQTLKNKYEREPGLEEYETMKKERDQVITQNKNLRLQVAELHVTLSTAQEKIREIQNAALVFDRALGRR